MTQRMRAIQVRYSPKRAKGIVGPTAARLLYRHVNRIYFDAQVIGNSDNLDGTTSNVGIRRTTCLLDVLLIETVNFARQKWPCKTSTQESLLEYFVGVLPSKFDFPRA